MQLKSSSCSSSSTSTSTPSMKLKTLIQNLLAHPLYRFLRAVSRAKSIFLEISKHNNKKPKLTMFYPRKASKNQRKIFFGSFRLHYNWCSSDVVPVPQPIPSSVSDINGVEDDESQLSGYLEWLEHKKRCRRNMFIANCHEKFLLEKVESYRRFQEMLDRSS
ncbi:BnaA04g27570D [Brassica napus]|uniref:BnaA04g27570D protein n=1 Tax=Brassica napus TaxID=3708 RepID=A0A078JC23_BRANA|nr:BnaA04g27570D [Brassica napus]